MWYTHGSKSIESITWQAKSHIATICAKSGCTLSKFFHARPWAGCLNFSSLEHSSSCHLKESAVFEHINSLLSLGINGTFLKVFAETRCYFFWRLKLTINFRSLNISWSSKSMTKFVILMPISEKHAIIWKCINFLIIRPRFLS